MSADWFCKIGGKKIGPLNGQQLKTAVAKRQLLPDHLVRRGEEGPWMPAGRIKGLFPEPASGSAPAKAAPLPTARPAAGPGQVPTASAAPTPPDVDLPGEFRVGGGHKHASFDADAFPINEPPPKMTRRKSKGTGLKKAEQQKLNFILACVIGGGLTVGMGILSWAIATGQFASRAVEKKEDPVAKAAKLAEAKNAEEAKKLKAEKLADAAWTKLPAAWTAHGKVQISVQKPKRQAPPEGAKVDAEKYPEVVVLPIDLKLKDDVKAPVPFTSWADDLILPNVSLKDDTGKNKYPLLAMVAKQADAKTITGKTMSVQLVFAAPEGDFKYLHLELPSTAFGETGMLDYEITKDQLPPGPAKKPVKKSDGPVAGGKPAEGKPGVAKFEEVTPSAGNGAKDNGDIGLVDPDKK